MQPTRRPLVHLMNRTLNHMRCSSSIEAGTSVSRDFEEIAIPVPWGHIAGKWYGPKDIRPLIGLHGWQNNAGAFDRLEPLLPQHIPFLSLDMPGHGLSSWLPEGATYHTFDYVSLLLRIMQAYKWNKISICGHSMSGLNGYVFSALFPDKVDMLICLDDLKPPDVKAKFLVDLLAERVGGAIKMEEQQMDNVSGPPCYDWEQLEHRLHIATNKELDKEVCKYVLERNVKPSEHEPNKYYFSRDGRIKNGLGFTLSHQVTMEMARRITCPHLVIKANEGHLWESEKNYVETLEVLCQNPNFEHHRVPGTHYVHVNNPERFAHIVSDFINKHRPKKINAKAEKL